MGIHKSTLDSVRQSELGTQIRELEEKIAHLKTYTLRDTMLLEHHLESLKEQHTQEINNGS